MHLDIMITFNKDTKIAELQKDFIEFILSDVKQGYLKNIANIKNVIDIFDYLVCIHDAELLSSNFDKKYLITNPERLCFTDEEIRNLCEQIFVYAKHEMVATSVKVKYEHINAESKKEDMRL